MGFWLLFSITCGISCFLGLWGIKRYNYVINPLMVFAIFDVGVLTLLSVTVTSVLDVAQNAGLSAVLYMTIIYIIGFAAVFLPRHFQAPRQLFDAFVGFVGKSECPDKFGSFNQLFVILVSIALFILLARTSGAGMLWVTSPRVAYQGYREGVGYFFLLLQWTLLGTLAYYIMTKRPRLTGLVISVFLYVLAAYFTGSKNNILAGLIISGAYYNFFIKKLSGTQIFVALIGILASFWYLLISQGSYTDIVSAISYFRDYAYTTAQFLMRFDEFKLQWGHGFISDFWFYVPRALYPGKPFEYGVLLIHETLYPGAAELGHTPGVLPWALSYLDFGAVGVFIAGVLTGFVRRGAYESFLNNRTNSLAFLLMVQFSIVSVFSGTLLTSLVVILFLCFFMRINIDILSPERS